MGHRVFVLYEIEVEYVVDYGRFEMRQQMLQEQTMELNSGTLKTTQKRTLFVRYVLLIPHTLVWAAISSSKNMILLILNKSNSRFWTRPVSDLFWTGAGPYAAFLTNYVQENSLILLFSTKFASNRNQHTEFKAQYRLHRRPKSQ